MPDPVCLRVDKSHVGESSSHDSNGLQITFTYNVLFDQIVTGLQAMGAEQDDDDTRKVPAYFSEIDPDPTESHLLVISKSPERDSANPNLWRVKVTYGIPRVNFEGGSGEEGAKWSKSISVKGVQNVETTDRDVAAKRLATVLGECFALSYPQVMYDEEITINYLTDTLDGDLIAARRGEINASAIDLTVTTRAGTYSRVFPQFTLKVTDCSYSIELDADSSPVWRVSLTLQYRSQLNDDDVEVGWYLQVVHKGFKFLAADDSAVLTSPVEVHLDAAGHKLTTDDVVRLPFQMNYGADLVADLLSGIT